MVRGWSLGVVQLLVFSCYASSLWLGAFLVQEELIQAGEFVTVSFLLPWLPQSTGAIATGVLCSATGGCVSRSGPAPPSDTGVC